MKVAEQTNGSIPLLKHIGYWCGEPSEVFPEKRDHRKCEDYPAWLRKSSAGTVKVVCTCPCHRKKKRQ